MEHEHPSSSSILLPNRLHPAKDAPDVRVRPPGEWGYARCPDKLRTVHVLSSGTGKHPGRRIVGKKLFVPKRLREEKISAIRPRDRLGKASQLESVVSEANLLSPPSPSDHNEPPPLRSHPPSLCVICRDVQEVSRYRPGGILSTFGARGTQLALTQILFPSRSGLSSIARAGRFSALPRSAIRPSALRAPISSRWASTAAGVGNGKIHQVSFASSPFVRAARRPANPTSALSQLLTTTNPAGHRCRRRWFVSDPIGNTEAASSAMDCSLTLLNSQVRHRQAPLDS